jgi:transcriptional regulator with XRE-family HTH domain
VTLSASRPGGRRHGHGQAGRPGIVAGAVLRSARLSAGVSQAHLAEATGVGEETVRAWEEGSSPLASVPLPLVAAVEASLRKSGASPDVIADLGAAAWCDLVILAIADHEDTTCLMADPVTNDVAFGELLAWCLSGEVPDRYRPHAEPGPLLADSALIGQATQSLTPPRGHSAS